jgi:hypothetical protein
MSSQPRACPFCLNPRVSTLASFHDTLTAFRCDGCRQVFYTVALRFAAQEPIVEPLQQRGGTLARRNAPRRSAPPPVPVVAARLPFGRRLRRP